LQTHVHAFASSTINATNKSSKTIADSGADTNKSSSATGASTSTTASTTTNIFAIVITTSTIFATNARGG
jgi:hypothetical protein